MSHEYRFWLAIALGALWFMLVVRIVRNQLIITRNDREIRRLKQLAVDEEAEAAMWAAKRITAAEEAEREGFTLCCRCKLRRVAHYHGEDSTMCEWCGI